MTGTGAFIADDLEVTNGTATVEATTDPLVWTATVTPDIGLRGQRDWWTCRRTGVQDVAGNANTATAAHS